METRLVPGTRENCEEAAEKIRLGQVVAFPTETVYGLGADGYSEKAVQAIFKAKGRPADNPLILHISELEMLADLAKNIPEEAYRLAEVFWPGPLTMIFRKTDKVPFCVTANLNTVAVRMPDHELARMLIRLAGCPIAAPSANRSGRPSPTTALHVLEDMRGRIPMILDGGRCRVGLESTVVDLTGSVATILRPGAVTAEMINEQIGQINIDERILRPVRDDEVVSSPGMKHRHYAPKGSMTVFEGINQLANIREAYDEAVAEGRKAAILCFKETTKFFGERLCYDLGSDSQAAQAAALLFNRLRQMDADGIEVILSQGINLEGMGLAVMNRMLRAAGFHVIRS